MTTEKKTVLVPGAMAPLLEGAETILAERGYEVRYLGEITPADIDEGLAHMDNDICVPTVAAVGQYLRWLAANGDAGRGIAVLAPEMCRDCRSTSAPELLPGVLRRAGWENVEVVGFSSAETRGAAPSEPSTLEQTAAQAKGTEEHDQPTIGICGNMPILATWEFRRAVCEHLEKNGCRVILPPLQRIADERDFLTPALEYFRETGVHTVICILPFGCLGGHVFARGQLRGLQEVFPDIELTILDYDPSASDVNLVNRTELVIQSAREKARSASPSA